MRFLPRLLILLAIAVLPLVGVQIYTALDLQREREAQLHRTSMAYAQAISTEFQALSEGVKSMLLAASVAPAVRGNDPVACQRYLADVKKRFAPDLAIGVLNADGTFKCRSEPEPVPTMNNSDRFFFREVMRTRDFAIGEYTSGRVTRQQAIHMAYPVTNEDREVTGVIVVPVKVSTLAARLSRIQLPPDSAITVADRNGTILVRLPDRGETGKRLPDDALPRVLGSEPVTYEGLRVFDNVPRVVALIPVNAPPVGISIAVALSKQVAAQAIRDAFRRSAYLIALALAVALLSALLIGRYTLKAEKELRRSRDEAMQASQSKTNFLAAASHDLRQPLQSMTMTVALLERRHPDDEDTLVIQRMHRAIANLSDLLNALLDISRLEAGLVKPERKPFAIADLLTDVREEFSAVAAARGLALEIAPCPAFVDSDPRLLGRILRNLVDNALKFTPSGGVVRLTCVARGESVDIQVIDNGIGIPEDKRAVIFGDFQQLNNPQRDRTKGLGLGLAIVDRMARLLNHTLTLNSAVGKGTTFTTSVPAAHAAPVPAVARVQHVRISGRVLLVEDDDDVLASTAALLREMGAEVTVARTGEEARLKLHERFDIVFADQRLPQESGLDFFRAARTMLGGAKLALLTGDPHVENLARNAEAGIVIIQKPVRAERLAELFSTTVSQ